MCLSMTSADSAEGPLLFSLLAVFLHYHCFSSMNHIFTKIIAQTAYLKRTESWLGSPAVDSVMSVTPLRDPRNTLFPVSLCMHTSQKQNGRGRPENLTLLANVLLAPLMCTHLFSSSRNPGSCYKGIYLRYFQKHNICMNFMGYPKGSVTLLRLWLGKIISPVTSFRCKFHY